MSDELEKRIDQPEQEVMDELNSNHSPYNTTTHYQCSFIVPGDETTEVIISTKTAGVCFAKSPEDALNQTKSANHYSHKSYASYILEYVRENLWTIDIENVELSYTEDPTITPMTDDELKDFEREVISANGF